MAQVVQKRRGKGFGSRPVVELLVSRGASIHKTNKQGGTPLRAAAAEGHLELVKFFVARGAKTRTKDEFGKYPVDYARENGHHAVAALLDGVE